MYTSKHGLIGDKWMEQKYCVDLFFMCHVKSCFLLKALPNPFWCVKSCHPISYIFFLPRLPERPPHRGTLGESLRALDLTCLHENQLFGSGIPKFFSKQLKTHKQWKTNQKMDHEIFLEFLGHLLDMWKTDPDSQLDYATLQLTMFHMCCQDLLPLNPSRVCFRYHLIRESWSFSARLEDTQLNGN